MGSTVVLRRGVVHGRECEANCEILARRQSPEHGSGYLEGFIMNAPPDLPDGEYLVVFDSHAMAATKKLGLWLSAPPNRV